MQQKKPMVLFPNCKLDNLKKKLICDHQQPDHVKKSCSLTESYPNLALQLNPGQIFINLRHIIFYYHARQKYFIKLLKEMINVANNSELLCNIVQISIFLDFFFYIDQNGWCWKRQDLYSEMFSVPHSLKRWKAQDRTKSLGFIWPQIRTSCRIFLLRCKQEQK